MRGHQHHETIAEVEIPYESGESFTIASKTCMHADDADHMVALADQFRETYAGQERVGIFDLGDMMSYITPDDKRADFREMAPATLAALGDYSDYCEDYLVNYHEPMAPQILAFVLGNHENTFWKKRAQNPTKRVVRRLSVMAGREIPFFPVGEGHLILKFVHRTSPKSATWYYKVKLAHGWGVPTVTPNGWKARYLRDALLYKDVDLCLYGHVHQLGYEQHEWIEGPFKTSRGWELWQRHMITGCCGTMKDMRYAGGVGYARQKGYGLVQPGWFEVTITPTTKAPPVAEVRLVRPNGLR